MDYLHILTFELKSDIRLFARFQYTIFAYKNQITTVSNNAQPSIWPNDQQYLSYDSRYLLFVLWNHLKWRKTFFRQFRTVIVADWPTFFIHSRTIWFINSIHSFVVLFFLYLELDLLNWYNLRERRKKTFRIEM